MSLSLLLLNVVAPAEPAWFYTGPGDEVVVIDGHSTIAGLPVGRSGHVVARVDDPDSIAALPEVAEVEVLPGDGRMVRVRPRDGMDEVAFSRALHDRGDVSWSHPDLRVQLVPHVLPDDPFITDQWHLRNLGQRGRTAGVDINAELAWTYSTGAGTLIAILDSGVDSDHPDLDVVVGWDYVERDADSNPDATTDEGPHGTSAAGLAAARGNNGIGVAGVAYDAQVYAIRLPLGESSASGSLTDIYDAFVEAVDAGAWVLSNSWGFGRDCPPFPTFWLLQEAVDYAEVNGREGLGAAVVFSAGNGDCDISQDGLQAIPEVISVAASNGHDYREGYSSFGAYIDVSAPSGAMLTTDIVGEDGYGSWQNDQSYYGWFNGTSASAPVVSGVLALMFSANPRLTAEEARQVLCETAVEIDVVNGFYSEEGWSAYYGCGRVDAGSAVAAVANEVPAAPTLIAPVDTAWVDRVLLRWEPAMDPDGDMLEYEVMWWIPGSGYANFVDLGDETHLDLTGQVAAGDVVKFRVTASDLWGPGDSSDDRSFTVVDHAVLPAPGEPSSDSRYDGGCECRAAGGTAARPPGLLVFVGLTILLARRRRGSRA